MRHDKETTNDNFEEIIFNSTEKSGSLTKTILNPAQDS